MPGTIIKQLREKIGYSQEGVASDMGISQSAYSKIENNQTELKVWHCKVLSKIFGYNVYDLLPDDFEIHKPQIITSENHDEVTNHNIL